MFNFDLNGLKLDFSGNESQIEPVSQEIGALYLKGITPYPSSGELLQIEVRVLPQSEYKSELQTSYTPNQSFAEHVPDCILKSSKKQLSDRVNRGIPRLHMNPNYLIESNIP